MSAYGCETLLFLEGFNSRNYYDGAIGEKKTNQFIEKKRTTQCNCKEWDRKDSRERIESKIEKELKTDTTRRKALCGSIEVRMSWAINSWSFSSGKSVFWFSLRERKI